MTSPTGFTKTLIRVYVYFSLAGFATPFGVFGMILAGRRFGSRIPNPGVGQTFPIDVSGRYGPGLTVYVTHGYGLTYTIILYFMFVWMIVLVCSAIGAVIVRRRRRKSQSTPQSS